VRNTDTTKMPKDKIQPPKVPTIFLTPISEYLPINPPKFFSSVSIVHKERIVHNDHKIKISEISFRLVLLSFLLKSSFVPSHRIISGKM